MADAPSSPPPGLEEYLANAQGVVSPSKATEPPEGLEDHLAELRSEKYGTWEQLIKTSLEGAAEGIAGPLAPMAEVGLGIATPEDIKGRAEENPITKGVTEVGGLIGSAFIPGGQAALLERAGGAAAKVLGVAGKTGWIARAGEQAVKGAVESAIFQGGKDLSEAYLGDPHQVAEHAISDIGLASVLGGVFGGAFGAIASKLAKEPTALVSQADLPGLAAGDLKTIISTDANLPAAKKDGLLDALNLGKRKINAKEIEGAAADLGLPATPGMTLESPLIGMQVDALSNSPYSLAGNRIRTQLDAAHEAAETVLKDAAASANTLSKDELGTQLQKSLTESTEAAYAPQKAAFERLSAMHESIPVSPESLEGLSKAFNEIKEVKFSPKTQEGKLVREVLDLTKNVKTAEDLTTIRNMASLKNEGVGADPLGWLKGKIRDELASAQEAAVESYSKKIPELAEQVGVAKATREGYKPYIKKLNTLSNWLGKGKIHGTEDALNFMNERLSATDVAKRLFSSSKDPEFLRFFSKEFPEQFKLIRDYQRMELLESAQRDGVLSPKAFFKKFNDLEPEIQKSLYSPEEIQKIKSSDLYFREAFPKNFNPSGTDHMRSLRAAAESPKGLLLANVRDAGMEKMIQLAEKGSDLYNAHALGKATAKGWKTAVAGTKALFDNAKEMPAKVIPILAHRENLDRLVSESVKNPDRLYGINDNNPVPEYNEAFSATSARAVAYLNSLKPDTDPRAPLDSRQPASSASKAAYNRALDIAQQPLSTLKSMKDGTLTSQDVITIKTIYPNLYNQLSHKLISEMTEIKAKGKTIPYQTKMGLSLFLGQPLDSTLTPQGIAAAQPAPPMSPPQAKTSKAPAYNSVKGLDSLSKVSMTPGQASMNRSITHK